MQKKWLIVFIFIFALFISGCSQYFGETKGVNVAGQQAQAADTALLQMMDEDGNGVIGQGDVDKFSIAFQSGQYDSGYDYDNDENVDENDFFIIAQYFGYDVNTGLLVKVSDGCYDRPIGKKCEDFCGEKGLYCEYSNKFSDQPCTVGKAAGKLGEFGMKEFSQPCTQAAAKVNVKKCGSWCSKVKPVTTTTTTPFLNQPTSGECIELNPRGGVTFKCPKGGKIEEILRFDQFNSDSKYGCKASDTPTCYNDIKGGLNCLGKTECNPAKDYNPFYISDNCDKAKYLLNVRCSTSVQQPLIGSGSLDQKYVPSGTSVPVSAPRVKSEKYLPSSKTYLVSPCYDSILGCSRVQEAANEYCKAAVAGTLASSYELGKFDITLDGDVDAIYKDLIYLPSQELVQYDTGYFKSITCEGGAPSIYFVLTTGNEYILGSYAAGPTAMWNAQGADTCSLYANGQSVEEGTSINPLINTDYAYRLANAIDITREGTYELKLKCMGKGGTAEKTQILILKAA